MVWAEGWAALAAQESLKITDLYVFSWLGRWGWGAGGPRIIGNTSIAIYAWGLGHPPPRRVAPPPPLVVVGGGWVPPPPPVVVVWVLGLAGWSQASGAKRKREREREEGRQRGRTEGEKECESMTGNEEKREREEERE